MILAPASFDIQLIKEDKTQYCKGLIALIQNSHALKVMSFTVHSQESEKPTSHFSTWRFHLLEKTPPEGLLNSLKWPLSGTENLPLCQQTAGIDSWMHT